jgi:hypothetical protein
LKILGKYSVEEFQDSVPIFKDINLKTQSSFKRIRSTSSLVSKGIFFSAIELSTEPNLREWKIKAEANGQTASHSFSVDHVLPKCKVEVVLPPFVTYNSSKLTAIRTAYT